MPLTQLTIVGAGLIGGSLALAARQKGAASRIVAIDRAHSHPRSQGIFDEWIQGDDHKKAEKWLASSDLTILCVPVGTIIDLLPDVLKATTGLVTDCGSTKQSIVHSVAAHPLRNRFIPGHPMAGRPLGGLENAQGDLFCGQRWILCPQQNSIQDLVLLKNFIGQVGAEVLELSAQDHDRSVAITSHVPQIIASLLAVLAEKNDALKAAGPGFASTTRVAGGAESMWHDIFETNGQSIGSTLIEVGEIMRTMGAQLNANQVDGALELLKQARKLRSH